MGYQLFSSAAFSREENRYVKRRDPENVFFKATDCFARADYLFQAECAISNSRELPLIEISLLTHLCELCREFPDRIRAFEHHLPYRSYHPLVSVENRNARNHSHDTMHLLQLADLCLSGLNDFVKISIFDHRRYIATNCFAVF